MEITRSSSQEKAGTRSQVVIQNIRAGFFFLLLFSVQLQEEANRGQRKRYLAVRSFESFHQQSQIDLDT